MFLSISCGVMSVSICEQRSLPHLIHLKPPLIIQHYWPQPGFPFWYPEPQQRTPRWLVRDRNFALQTPARHLAATGVRLRDGVNPHFDPFPMRFLGHLAIPRACFPRFSPAGLRSASLICPGPLLAMIRTSRRTGIVAA
jgi:hypothetical protein